MSSLLMSAVHCTINSLSLFISLQMCRHLQIHISHITLNKISSSHWDSALSSNNLTGSILALLLYNLSYFFRFYPNFNVIRYSLSSPEIRHVRHGQLIIIQSFHMNRSICSWSLRSLCEPYKIRLTVHSQDWPYSLLKESILPLA